MDEAVLTLVLKAQNLADEAVSDLAGGLDKVGSKAGEVAGKITGAFSGMGRALGNAIGNAVENLAQGGDLGPTLAMGGAYMAGQLAENFGGTLIEKLAGSSLIAAITAPLTALGTAAGSLIAAAVPIGIALLPAILVGALIAVIGLLIVNEELRNKVIGFVGGLVGTIADALGKFLGILPQVFGKAFGAAWDFIINGVAPFIGQLVELWLTLPLRLAGLGLSILGTIIDGLAGLPGKLMDLVGSAFRSLKIDIGPFHITGSGITIDMPRIDLPHFATGVQGFAGGLAVVGERGPEIVRLPAGADVYQSGTGPSGAGLMVQLVGVTERDIVDMVDRELYFRLRLAGTARG
jgi:hypothetical protein